jgi:hypothetical protein
MSALEGMQDDFTQGLTGNAEPLMARLAGERKQRGVAVYRHAFRARLADTVRGDFPVTGQMLGDPLFGDLCAAYVDCHRSTHWSLRWFARHLPGMLADVLPDHPGAAEMAAFEWTLTKAFDGPDASVATVDDLAQMPAERWPFMRLRPHPTVHMVSLAWNTVDIWNATHCGEPLPPPEQAPCRCLIWRERLTVRFRTMGDDEANIWEMAGGGAPFADLCSALDGFENPALRAATLLKGWLTDGLITTVECQHTPGR